MGVLIGRLVAGGWSLVATDVTLLVTGSLWGCLGNDLSVCCRRHRSGGRRFGLIRSLSTADALTYVGHILPPELEDAYLGHLMVEPIRHVAGWGELTDAEAAALGKLINHLGRALMRSEGAEHIYSMVIGDAVPHLHIHVVPRYPDTPREFWGVRIGDWLDAPRGGVQPITATCERVRHQLESIRDR